MNFYFVGYVGKWLEATQKLIDKLWIINFLIKDGFTN